MKTLNDIGLNFYCNIQIPEKQIQQKVLRELFENFLYTSTTTWQIIMRKIKQIVNVWIYLQKDSKWKHLN